MKGKIISTRNGGKQLSPLKKWFIVKFWKFQWITRKIGLIVIPSFWKVKRSGNYIEGDVQKGFVSTKGKTITWGKKYNTLFFLGLIE